MEDIYGNILLRNLNEEMESARKLHEDKMEKTRASENIIEEKNTMEETVQSLYKVFHKNQVRVSLKDSVTLGFYLRSEIKQGGFTGGAYYSILLLSLIKDIVDYFAWSILNPVNIFLIITLFIVSAGQGRMMKKFLLKRGLAIIGIGMIPLVSFVPINTFGTIWIKIQSDKKIKKLRNQLKKINRKIKDFEKKYNKK